MITVKDGKQSISVSVEADDPSWNKGVWRFCTNGYQFTGVDITIEQFDMLVYLVTNPSVVEYYEKLRKEK